MTARFDPKSSRAFHCVAPSYVSAIDVANPFQSIEGLNGYRFVYAIVLVHGVPVGRVNIPVEGSRCDAQLLQHAVYSGLESEICREHYRQMLEKLYCGFEPPNGKHLPIATVAVCSRDRHKSLVRCLDSIQDLKYDGLLDVVVILNCPSDPSETYLIEDKYPGFRVFVENEPGLDNARNRAIKEARGEFVCFTDDDTEVDSNWISQAVRTFQSNPEVACVTGLIAPAALETDAQAAFENIGGFGKGYSKRFFRVNFLNRQGHWSHLGAGNFGAGANMSFRKSVFDRVGDFDRSLDVGTPTEGAGDLEMFFRVLEGGFVLAYDPGCLVYHHHRGTWEELRRQLASWGVALHAFLVSVFRGHSRLRRSVLWFYLRWLLVGQINEISKEMWRPTFLPRRWLLDFVTRAPLGVFRYRYVGQAAGTRKASALAPKTRRPSRIAVRHRNIEELKEITDTESYQFTKVFFHHAENPSFDHTFENAGHPIRYAELFEVVALHQKDTCSMTHGVLSASPRRVVGPHVWRTSVSIVIATANRPQQLRRCLDSISNQESPHSVQIIVVDNNPSTRATLEVVNDFPDIRYVAEARKGLASARNAGIAVSSGNVIAMTDDDVVVSDLWLDRLVAPFERSDVGAVTGLTIPLELETAPQIWFEDYGGLSRGYSHFEVSRKFLTSSYKMFPRVWDLGATANAAFRGELVRTTIGKMDESLGPGTPAGGGEDIDLMHRCLKAGWTHIYSPEAWVSHQHRRTRWGFCRTLFQYSTGHGSYLLKKLIQDGDLRAIRRMVFELPAWDMARLLGLQLCHFPRKYVIVELVGLASSPACLMASTLRQLYLSDKERVATRSK